MSKSSILVLGAGFVTKPLVHYLSSHDFHVIVASRTLTKTQDLIKGAKNAEAREADVERDQDLEKIEKWIESEVVAVVSMLPYLFHVKVAHLAVKHKKHFFTTSYVSEDMRKLEKDAIDAGIVMINECGVDPGTDHMSAMRVIHKVQSEGGKIVSFTSYCGGLPKAEDNNNPFGYKFSWAPRGVLLASKNSAKFLKDGKEVNIPGEALFENYEVEEIEGLGKFETYPNRNSCLYASIYGLDHAQTVIRGTYRSPGWCRTIKKIGDLGYLSLEKTNLSGLTYAEFLSRAVGISDPSKLDSELHVHLKIQPDDPIIKAITWLGLNSNEKIPPNLDTPLDMLCQLMLSKMKYEKNERDMLLMRHRFVAEYPDSNEVQIITSTLIDYGIEGGDSSMSRTVSYPVAIALRLFLQGKVKIAPGLHVPTVKELYVPILEELEQLGIKFVEVWGDKVKKV
eukprot:TRINITY_DN1092_c0_g1_i1.p1 TRINITY_DN1092_c0_g1~~TRINITY_DN1092_c0_g1_i1.p1  ORF type:complete len:484 (-),score=99.55 TRINITY_DN1092_c0_g1_i1:77-1432(-)